MPDTLETRFHGGQTFDAFLSTATKNVDLYRAIRSRASAPPDLVARVTGTRQPWHLLVISEDWCGDAVNIVPAVDALAAAAPNVDLRIIARDRHLDLMDRHLTNGRTRSIPVVLVLDEHYVERAWWGPRPQALQRWFESAEAQALSKDERYKALRTSYARDRGRSVVAELITLIEAIAAQPAQSEPAPLHASAVAA